MDGWVGGVVGGSRGEEDEGRGGGVPVVLELNGRSKDCLLCDMM